MADTDIATWLIGQEVMETFAVNIELPADAIRVDQLFRAVLADGRVTLVHVEFQGRSSHLPMKWRMLEYMARIAGSAPDLDLFSVVLYVGQGAGASDEGEHQVNSPAGGASLGWRYRVVRLWQMAAEELLAFGRPGLLPLIGQTRIEQPEVIIPQVIATLKKDVEDRNLQTRLLASLLALTDDEEIVAMIEKLSDSDELLLDTPYLRRLRNRARQEGLQEGHTEGHTRGRAEGRAEGIRLARQQDILDALVLRFELSARVYRDIEKALIAIDKDAQLEQLFAAAIGSATIDEVQQVLAAQNAPSAAQKSSPS
jgi:predicted transposase YdaD